MKAGKSMKMAHTMLALLVAAIVQMAQANVCGSQEWFHGWNPAMQITYQVMDWNAATSMELFAVGAYTDNVASFWHS